jgi:hypothetical protein
MGWIDGSAGEPAMKRDSVPPLTAGVVMLSSLAIIPVAASNTPEGKGWRSADFVKFVLETGPYQAEFDSLTAAQNAACGLWGQRRVQWLYRPRNVQSKRTHPEYLAQLNGVRLYKAFTFRHVAMGSGSMATIY